MFVVIQRGNYASDQSNLLGPPPIVWRQKVNQECLHIDTTLSAMLTADRGLRKACVNDLLRTLDKICIDNNFCVAARTLHAIAFLFHSSADYNPAGVRGSRTITRTTCLFHQSNSSSPPQNTFQAFRHSPMRKHNITADNHGKTTESMKKSTKPANTIPATISIVRPTRQSVVPPQGCQERMNQ